MSVLRAVKDRLAGWVKKEPAVVVGAVASLVVYLAGTFGVVLDEASVQTVLTPIVVSLFTRPFVSPVGNPDA